LGDQSWNGIGRPRTRLEYSSQPGTLVRLIDDVSAHRHDKQHADEHEGRLVRGILREARIANLTII
jgi:hypothetical protein